MSEQGSLLDRAVKGGVWVFGLRITQQVLALTRLIVLARLLSPNDFGLMGIALLTMATVDTVTQTGFELALIQRKERTEDYLDSAWTASILRGIVLFAILQLLAPVASGFFKSPRAELMIQAIALSVVLRGFQNIGIVYFRKELQFRKQFIYEFSGRMADFIVAIAAAFILRNAWVLVLAFLAGDVVRLISSYALQPYRPRWRFEIDKMRELFGFGKWILGSSTIVFLLTQGDKALIGRLIGATMLGYYQIADKISNLPATEFSMVISQVTIPAYSKLQDSLERLRGAYLRVLQVTAFVAAPLAGAILLLAPDLTRAFLGEKWMPAVPAMQVLAVSGAFRAVIATCAPVFVAVGRPRIMTKYQFIQLCVLAVLIYPLTVRWGISGAAWAVAIAGVVASGLFLRRVVALTSSDASEVSRLIFFPPAAAVVAALPVLAMRLTGRSPGGLYVALAISAAAYALTYFALTNSAGRLFGYNLSPIIRSILSAVRPGKQPDP
jgi:O-antigen/teichoic acid export membrane protein